MSQIRLAQSLKNYPPTSPDLGVSHWATCGPWTIHYRVAGAGPSVLLLHGLGGSSRYWDFVVADLAHRYRLIMPDLLGFGDSAKPYVVYDPDLHCLAIEAILADAALTEPCAVIGHSLGAVLMLALLARGSVQPASAVLITPPFPTGLGQMREEVRRLSPTDRLLLSCVPVTRLTHFGMQAFWPAVCRLRTRHALFSPELLAEYGKFTYHSFMSTANHCLLDYDLRPALSQLDPLPMLVLSGALDRRVPASHGPDLATLLGHACLERLPSRHHPALSHPDLLAARLLAWLDEHERRDPSVDL